MLLIQHRSGSEQFRRSELNQPSYEEELPSRALGPDRLSATLARFEANAQTAAQRGAIPGTYAVHTEWDGCDVRFVLVHTDPLPLPPFPFDE